MNDVPKGRPRLRALHLVDEGAQDVSLLLACLCRSDPLVAPLQPLWSILATGNPTVPVNSFADKTFMVWPCAVREPDMIQIGSRTKDISILHREGILHLGRSHRE